MKRRLQFAMPLVMVVWLSVLSPGATTVLVEREELEGRRLESLVAEVYHRTILEAAMAAGYDSLRFMLSVGIERDSTLEWVPLPLLLDVIHEKHYMIHGLDDRWDIFAIKDKKIQELSRSVAALVDTAGLEETEEGWVLRTETFAAVDNLCPTERFREQPVALGMKGTAFLIDSQTVATAAHITRRNPSGELAVVFDYRMLDTTTAKVVFDSSHVYRGMSSKAFYEDAADWAVITLDRPVVGREPLVCREEGVIGDTARVYLMGYPRGLPLKAAGGARIMDNSHGDFFVASLDTYHHNSGSPVFNTYSNMVEGLLMAAEPEELFWDSTLHCKRSLPCEEVRCLGADVMRITEVLGGVDAAIPITTSDKWLITIFCDAPYGVLSFSDGSLEIVEYGETSDFQLPPGDPVVRLYSCDTVMQVSVCGWLSYRVVPDDRWRVHPDPEALGVVRSTRVIMERF